MTLDTAKLKAKLEQEKKLIEGNLSEVARVNPQNPNDWETTPVPEGNNPEMHDEVADFLEDLDEREATEEELETRLDQINAALDRMDTGTYGLCETCDQPIEIERLEVNPAATTCKAHRSQE